MSENRESLVRFLIAPIGEDGSEIRRRSDQVMNHIVEPSVQQCGYRTVRADQISEPGLITSQVIQHLLEDPLVVAGLTGRNPNVFYELAIRHAVRKPVVQIIQIGEPVPFDVAQSRTIQVDHRDLDSAAHCREELVRHIRAVESDPLQVDSPISVAVDLQSLRDSDKPLEKMYAEIIPMLQDIKALLMEQRLASPPPDRLASMLADVAFGLERLSEVVASPEVVGAPEPILDDVRAMMYRLQRSLEATAAEAGIALPLFHFRRERPVRRRKFT